MSGLSFRIAMREDEPDLRRLLRENPMAGAYAVGFEKEPDAFGADFGLNDQHCFIIARRADSGEAVGMCEYLVAPAFVDGKIAPLPYLASLRVAKGDRHRIAILRGGFAAVRTCLEAGHQPYALTSIAADNDNAERVLTAGLPGLPTYSPAGCFSTLLVRCRGRHGSPRVTVAGDKDIPALSAFLQKTLARYQFAPVWTEDRLRRCSSRFLVWRNGGAIRGSVCVWDQRSRRQTVVRSYPRPIARLRWLINLAAPVVGLPSFPRTPAVLASAFLSHLAAEDEDPEILDDLLASALASAAASKLETVVLGCAEAHPWRSLIRSRWKCLEYQTNLYRVHWDAIPALDQRLPMPEAALL